MCVIHVQNAWRPGHPDINWHAPWQRDAKAAGRSTEGSWGVEFFEPLAPIDGELVVRKRAVSGFAGTDLDRLLRVRDVSAVVIAGVITNFAAEGTARDASDRVRCLHLTAGRSMGHPASAQLRHAAPR